MKKEHLKSRIIGSIERYMEAGDPIFTAEYLLKSSDGDMELLNSLLDQWEKEGRIKWRKPISGAKPEDQVVRFSKFIRSDVPWPPPIRHKI